ncbi:hypothetical protein FQZ97_238400 [compost metagenome]
METRAEAGVQPVLQAEVAVPDHSLEKGIDEGDDQQRGAELRAEPGALGDAAGNDGRDGRGEGQQEKELHQRVTMVGGQHAGRFKEGHAIGDPVADEEIGQGRDRKIGKDLRQGVDLVLLAHRTHFEESEAGVHGQYHDRAHQDEQSVGTVDQGFHGAIEVFHWRRRLRQRGKSTKAVQARPPAHHPEAVPHRKGSNANPDLVQTGLRRENPEQRFLLIFMRLGAASGSRRAIQGAPIQRISPQPRTRAMQAPYQRTERNSG